MNIDLLSFTNGAWSPLRSTNTFHLHDPYEYENAHKKERDWVLDEAKPLERLESAARQRWSFTIRCERLSRDPSMAPWCCYSSEIARGLRRLRHDRYVGASMFVGVEMAR